MSLSTISFAADFQWSFNGNLQYFAADNGDNSDPNAILPSFGASFALKFSNYFRIEFTEDIYFAYYEFNYSNFSLSHELGYPMTCNLENRSAFVIGFVTGIQFTLNIPLGVKGTALRFFAGPVADLRLAFLAPGLNHPNDFLGDERDAKIQTNAISKYFWSNGRFVYFTAGMGADFPLNDSFLLGLDLRVWMPVYRLWTKENIPAIDGWRFGAGVRITLR